MPPRFAYWTILIDNAPTAFRARDQQELMPTVAQLKRTNDSVELKWFAHGKLWDSPEAQHAAERRPHPPPEKRDRDWRPGGQHKDPRARFDKEKRRRKKREDRASWNASKPEGDAGRERDRFGSRPPRPDRPWRDKPAGSPRGDRPWKDRPPRPPREGRAPTEGGWRGEERRTQHGAPPERKPGQNKTGARPHGDRKPWQKPAGGPPRGDRPWSGKPRDGAPHGDRQPWQKPAGGPPRSDRPWSGKPRDAGPRGDRKPWQEKPADRPRGDRSQWGSKPPRSGERPWRKRKDEPPDEK
jgi:hypothetical protein